MGGDRSGLLRDSILICEHAFSGDVALVERGDYREKVLELVKVCDPRVISLRVDFAWIREGKLLSSVFATTPSSGFTSLG
jgi:hypothetical protein